MIAVQEKDYATAVHYLRAILVREPKALRVRLELARTFYLQHDYDNAERQFRLARASEPPTAVKLNVSIAPPNVTAKSSIADGGRVSSP